MGEIWQGMDKTFSNIKVKAEATKEKIHRFDYSQVKSHVQILNCQSKIERQYAIGEDAFKIYGR